MSFVHESSVRSNIGDATTSEMEEARSIVAFVCLSPIWDDAVSRGFAVRIIMFHLKCS